MYQPPSGGQPPYGNPQPFYPQQPPPSRANGPLIAAIGCGALVLIGVLLVVLLVVVNQKDDPKDPVVLRPPLTTSIPVPTPSSTFVSPKCKFFTDNTFSSDCAGTWSGEIIQTKPKILRFKADLVIESGSSKAAVTYSAVGLYCTGTMTALSNTSGYKALYQENISSVTKDKCATLVYDTLLPAVIKGVESIYLSSYNTRADAEAGSNGFAIGTLTKQS
ncbi:MAG: hypothetical protein ABIS86_02825 [Streptosporangiaceae bacterium]